MMQVKRAIYFLFFALLILDFYCRGSEVPVTQRLARGDLKEYVQDDPNFWPVRGRRDGKDPEILYFGASDGPSSYSRGGRKSKEDGTGVFWAGRGRSFDANEVFDGEDDDFWAHRGRSAETDNDVPWSAFSTQEPGWIWLVRREAGMVHAKLLNRDSHPWGRSYRSDKREIAQQKMCHLKRKSSNLLREIPGSDQFWPVRGKKADYTVVRNKRPTNAFPTVQEDNSFWPVRGKKDKESWEELNSRDKQSDSVKEDTKTVL